MRATNFKEMASRIIITGVVKILEKTKTEAIMTLVNKIESGKGMGRSTDFDWALRWNKKFHCVCSEWNDIPT